MVNLMNTRLGELLYSALALKSGHGYAFKFAFKEDVISNLVTYLNTRNLEKGLDSKGRIISNKYTKQSVYSARTEQIYKESIGRIISAGSNYTMKYSGDFWQSIELAQPNLDFVDIKSEHIKRSFTFKGVQTDEVNLFNLYGEDIVGLQERDYIILRKNVLPYYIKYARGILGIN
jgi:hypothetical protein